MELSKDERFPVDHRALDEQWEEQPAFFLEYAVKLADANAKVDEAKDELEHLRARLDAEIRAAAVLRGSKTTEAAIVSSIVLDSDYARAQTILREAQAEAAFLKAEVAALDQRKAALENLVRLHGQEYFALPAASPEDRAAYQTKKASVAVRKALTRGK